MKGFKCLYKFILSSWATRQQIRNYLKNAVKFVNTKFNVT